MTHYLSSQKFMAWLLIILINSILSVSMAQTVIPPLNNGVMDSANVLKASEKSKLDEKIMQFEHESGSQIAVLIIPQLNNEDIVNYGVRVMEEWKLGRKDIDDGVLLIISINDRKTRLEVGYGLESAIPDITAAKILNEYLAPHFKNQNYYQGINQATYAIIALIKQESLPSIRDTKPNNNDIPFWVLKLILSIIGIAFILFIIAIINRLRAPFPRSHYHSTYDHYKELAKQRSHNSSNSSSSSSGSSGRSGGEGRSGGGGATGGW